MTVNLPTDAISVRQPWAWAIIHAGKNIENRGAVALRHMRLNRGSRTTLAVHAAQGMTQAEYSFARDFMAGIGVTCPPPGDLVRGAIIGAVPKPNDSAPSSAALITSRPVFMPPSACTITRSRRPLAISDCRASDRPSSHGVPA